MFNESRRDKAMIYKTMKQAKAALAAYEAKTGKQAIIHIVGRNKGYKLIAWGA